MPYMTRIVAIITAIAASAACAGGCGVASGDERITLTVLASSSFTEAFQELGAAYHAAHPNVTPRFEFGGSLEMASDVEEHLPGDVLATTDRVSMAAADDRLFTPHAFAYDALTIAVAPGNPKRIRGLADLSDRRVRVVLGGPDVPVGRYAARVLSRAGVTVRPTSEQADARTVLTRIRTGRADAGIVYFTDIRSAGIAADSVPIPARQNVTVTCYAAAVRDDARSGAAKDFVAWLGSPEAKSIMHKYGFPTP
jgi:molybdate transport system substrate-binding protein